jgi:beta-amylase
LQLNVVSANGEVVNVDELVGQLRVLKGAGVDGVMVDCWWGIVEANRPQEYNWTGYKRLFQVIREIKLKLQVSIAFTAIPIFAARYDPLACVSTYN